MMERGATDWVILVFHWVSCAVLFGGVVGVMVNWMAMPELRRRRREKGIEEAPRVSILVPARDEERNIERCVRSLLAQDYPDFEVLVLDDQSSDGTASILSRLGLSEEAGTLLRGRELPAGWVGKNWACHQLQEAASGEYLFFTDADTEHEPGMVSAMVELSREHVAGLVSAWPEQITESFGEKLVVSLLPFVGGLLYPHGLLRLMGMWPWMRGLVPEGMRRLFGAANGQALLFLRRDYEVVGGHEGLRGHLVEDIAFGRAFAERMGEEGLWWVNVNGAGLVRCRMYRNFGEVWEGFTKNSRAAFEGRRFSFWICGVMWVVWMAGPFVWAMAGGKWAWYGCFEVGLIYVMRVMVCLWMGGSWWSVWLHPVAALVSAAIGLNSWRKSVGSGVSWKRRVYSVNDCD